MKTKFAMAMLTDPASGAFVCGFKWVDSEREVHPIMGQEGGVKGEGSTQEETFTAACFNYMEHIRDTAVRAA